MHRHTNFLGEKPIDSLQLMMDASNSNNGKITDEEIAANAFVFILAGYVPPIPYWGPQIVRICSHYSTFLFLWSQNIQLST